MPMPTRTVRTISPTSARRLAIARQQLSGPRPTPNADTILAIFRALRCIQLDPINAVARSHLLVLFSRLGVFDPALLDELLWQDCSIFEYWAHCASLVLTEDYPIHRLRMRHLYTGATPAAMRANEWLQQNASLRDEILQTIRTDGPRHSQHFPDTAVTDWESSGWTSGRNVNRMLDYLWKRGEIMVVGRKHQHRLWDVTERFLPLTTQLPELTDVQVVIVATEHSLQALGVAREGHIKNHFTRNHYPGLATVLQQLEKDETIIPLHIADERATWPGTWYLHQHDLPLLAEIEAGAWEPRTTLLSPFDNLICDRARTELLFDYFFRIEIYVPKEKRQYGYYALPILHGDTIIGNIDPLFNRKQKVLEINAIHLKPEITLSSADRQAIERAIDELGQFVGATSISYKDKAAATVT